METRDILNIFTLRISGVTGFGPFEENDEMDGAMASLSVLGSETKIVAIGFLIQVDFHFLFRIVFVTLV